MDPISKSEAEKLEGYRIQNAGETPGMPKKGTPGGHAEESNYSANQVYVYSLFFIQREYNLDTNRKTVDRGFLQDVSYVCTWPE